jgi:hypothetical protein
MTREAVPTSTIEVSAQVGKTTAYEEDVVSSWSDEQFSTPLNGVQDWIMESPTGVPAMAIEAC